jgi:hypothetical protein
MTTESPNIKFLAAMFLCTIGGASRLFGQRVEKKPNLEVALHLVLDSAGLDLGTIDSGSDGHGVVQIVNFGDKTLHFTPAKNTGVNKVRVVYPADLAIVPGGSVSVDCYVDGHGDLGPIATAARVFTDDPWARVIKIPVKATVALTTDVRPYHDTVFAKPSPSGTLVSTSVPFQFIPSGNSGNFIQVWLEDPLAPLALENTTTPAGFLFGTVQVDVKKIAGGAPKMGATRVLGITANGSSNYFSVQWLVQP